MKRLLVFMKGYKKEAILGPLFKLLEASFELIVPLVMASIIDVGIVKGDKNHIFIMCGALILLALVGLISSVTAQFFAAKAAEVFQQNFATNYFPIYKNCHFRKWMRWDYLHLLTE